MIISNDIAIDLGTANTLIYSRNKGLIYNAPSYVAQYVKSKKIMAMGQEAKEMLGRTNPNIMTSRPLIDGVISEHNAVLPMLQAVLKAQVGQRLKGRMTISVPSGVTEIEMRAVMDLGNQLGYRKLEIVDEPIVAALGEGVDVNEPQGQMIVDVGAGTTDIAVISLGSVVQGATVKVAGDDFDEAIIKTVRDVYKLSIGKLTAEHIKLAYIRHYNDEDREPLECFGLHIVKGVPEKRQLEWAPIEASMMPLVETLVTRIHEVLERTEPELVSDIMETGIILTGGGSMMPMMQQQIEERTQIPVRLSKAPLFSVGNGLMMKLDGYAIRQKEMTGNAYQTNVTTGP